LRPREVALRLQGAESLVAMREAAKQAQEPAASPRAGAEEGGGPASPRGTIAARGTITATPRQTITALRRHTSTNRLKGYGVDSPTSAPPARGGLNGKVSALQRGYQAWEGFMEFAIRRYGNSVRLWFAMDPEEHMKIGEMQFARACEEMGYRGNVAALWRYLDKDGSRHINLTELDASAAMLLAEFKLLLHQHFDGKVAKAIEVLDENRSNKIFKAEFVSALRKLGYQGRSKQLFDLLARQSLGFMSAEDLNFLERWNPPPYIFSVPDVQGFVLFKESMLNLHGNALRVWMKTLDKDRNMRLSWDEWRGACLRLERTSPRPPHGPQTLDQTAAMWRALDPECSGWASLREFDPTAYEALSGFKRWLDEEMEGSVFRALKVANATNDGLSSPSAKQLPAGAASRPALKLLLRRHHFSKEHSELIVSGLDTRDTGVLTDADLKFLERWDLSWEDWLVDSGCRPESLFLPSPSAAPTAPAPAAAAAAAAVS